MKRLNPRLSSQHGISLVEMSIAIAILAVALVGTLMGVQKVKFDQRLNKAREDIPVTLTALSSAYATQTSTVGATTQVLSLMNVWPKDRVTDAGTASVRVNGSFPDSQELVFHSPYAHPPRIAQGNQGIAYWVTNIPPEACLPLLQTMATHGSVANLYVFPMTTTPAANVRRNSLVSFVNGNILTLNMTTATNDCSGSGNKQVVAIVARA